MPHLAYLASLSEQDHLSGYREGLEYIRFGERVTPDTKIFIKPNLTFPEYRPGVMTSPEAVAAALQAISDYTPHIWIGDSDSGGYNRFSMDLVYASTGLREVCARHGAKIVNLSSLPRRPIHFRYKRRKFALDLPVLLTDEMDFTVTMPVPKVHCNTGVSLSFKNQWGCIPENRDRLRLHPYFQHVILEVNRAIRAGPVLMDGRYGLNGNGPMKGIPVELGWILVAGDLGSAARLACELMQIELDRIPHLRYLESRAPIPARAAITINRDPAPFLRERFYLRRKVTDLPGLLAFRNPWIAHLAYFSPLSGFLHKLLYLVREPFYDYGEKRK